MADLADKAQEKIEAELESAIAAARGDIQPGVQGECDLCGEWHSRLVNSACPQCRDKYKKS